MPQIYALMCPIANLKQHGRRTCASALNMSAFGVNRKSGYDDCTAQMVGGALRIANSVTFITYETWEFSLYDRDKLQYGGINEHLH
jgi:hypothetical protein